MILLEVPDDVLEADVGADDAGEEPDHEDETVLQRAENELWPGVRVPVHRCVDLSEDVVDDGDAGDDHEDEDIYQSRRHEREGGHLDRPKQGDKQVQPRHCCRQTHWIFQVLIFIYWWRCYWRGQKYLTWFQSPNPHHAGEVERLTCEKVETNPGEKLDNVEHPGVEIVDENL